VEATAATGRSKRAKKAKVVPEEEDDDAEEEVDTKKKVKKEKKGKDVKADPDDTEGDEAYYGLPVSAA
jgi:hypothetical protein